MKPWPLLLLPLMAQAQDPQSCQGQLAYMHQYADGLIARIAEYEQGLQICSDALHAVETRDYVCEFRLDVIRDGLTRTLQQSYAPAPK